MCGVRVLVNPAKKRGRGIFTDLLGQQMATTGMLVEERSDVVNETGYKDQGSRLRLFLDYNTVWCEYQRFTRGGGAKTHSSDMRRRAGQRCPWARLDHPEFDEAA